MSTSFLPLESLPRNPLSPLLVYLTSLPMFTYILLCHQFVFTTLTRTFLVDMIICLSIYTREMPGAEILTLQVVRSEDANMLQA